MHAASLEVQLAALWWKLRFRSLSDPVITLQTAVLSFYSCSFELSSIDLWLIQIEKCYEQLIRCIIIASRLYLLLAFDQYNCLEPNKGKSRSIHLQRYNIQLISVHIDGLKVLCVIGLFSSSAFGLPFLMKRNLSEQVR
jgi:hypothetical protein